MSKKIIGIFLIFSIIYLLIGMSITPVSGNVKKVISFCNSNNPPYEPSNPLPFNGTVNRSICPLYLRWTGGDPDGDDVTYDVYFGNNNPPPQICFNISVNSTYTNLLNFNTTYYWKIVAWDEHGLKKSGPIWYFTTEKNLPPYFPSKPIPEDGEPRVPIDIGLLLWNCSDPNPCDTLRYDVYFDDDFPPVMRSCQQKENYWWIPYTLTLYQTYYWQIVAWDSGGLSTKGPIWSFTTGLNQKPVVDIQGPSQGLPKKNYEFKFTVIDPDGHDVMLYVDWDDGNQGWIDGVYESGSIISLNHSWPAQKLYKIEAKAKDQFNLEGDSVYHDFLSPRSISLIVPFLQRYLSAIPIT